MSIQAVMTNISETISSVPSASASGIIAAAQWMGRSVSVIGQSIWEFAKNAVEVATPFFASFKHFVIQHRGIIGVTVGALTATVIAAFVAVRFLESIFSRSSCTAPAGG